MKKNVGNIDRLIRILVGIAAISAGLYYESWLGILGVILIITAFTGTCLFYLPFGISTCKLKENK